MSNNIKVILGLIIWCLIAGFIYQNVMLRRPTIWGSIDYIVIIFFGSIMAFIYFSITEFIGNIRDKIKLKELRKKCPTIAPFDLQRINYQTLGRVEGSGNPRKAELILLSKAVKLGANAIVLEADHRTTYSGYTGDSLSRNLFGDYYIKKGQSYSGVTSDMSGYAIKILD